MEILAKRLKWLREKERYSQSEIAKKIGMTPSGYQKIEYSQRDPNLDVLVELCNIFNVSADFLLGRQNFTDELTKLAVMVEHTEGMIDVYRREINNSLQRISEMRKQMIDLAQKEGFASKRTIVVSEKLDETMKEHQHIQYRISTLEEEMREHLLQYIIKLLDIPDSKPNEDERIKRYVPYDIIAQMTIFNEFELILKGDNIGTIGTYTTVKSEAEVDQVTIELLKKLNGKLFNRE
jgi:transcriptional regulator with XRE-family HTH domain